MGALTPLMVVRTVLLNALGSLLFGWPYWRRTLKVRDGRPRGRPDSASS
jgi:hypothetical protein